LFSRPRVLKLQITIKCLQVLNKRAKGFVIPRLAPVNKYPVIGKAFQKYYSVFTKTRELTDETIDTGTVKLAVSYLISAIAYFPVFHVILQFWKIVSGCQIRHVITSFGNQKTKPPWTKLQEGF
jgi:hypothetical protein